MEPHADTEPHLHAGIQFPSQRKIEDFSTFLENVFGKNVNVNRPTSQKGWEKWLTYCSKQGNYAEIPYKLEITKTRSKKELH
jgi:hypothetical protein